MSMWLALVLGCTMFVFQTAQPKNDKQVSAEAAVAVQQPAAQEAQWITIFIHGTVGLRAHVTLSTFVQLIRDEIEHTTYQHIVSAIRNDPFFFQSQPMNYQGLWPIVQTTTPRPGDAAAAIARICSMNGPQETTCAYTFGWSGLLSCKARYKDSEQLYKELRSLIGTGKESERPKNLKIRIYGYSHGGSIALSLASIRQNHYPEDTFVIDELIMCGTPVQSETNHLINDPIFEKIYHIYSRKDKIQTIDFITFQRCVSRRRFAPTSACDLPKKLTQIEIKIKTSRACHKTTDPAKLRYRVDASPRHSEFWFFGWTPTAYRGSFPLYPLPVTSLLPSILSLVREYMPEEPNVIVELRPTAGVARLRRRHHFDIQQVPWLSTEQLTTLKEVAATYQPELFSEDAQIAHTKSAVASITGHIPMRQSALCWC